MLPGGLPAGRARRSHANGATITPHPNDVHHDAIAPPTTVAAYYFPNYHQDPRSDVWYGRGWTEWELVKSARPRFPGHQQPVTPAWDCFDEAQPDWAARQIDLAARFGIGAFLVDWYWYEDGPYLQAALEQGLLRAPNSGQVKFALMWANHDWSNIQPARAGQPFKLLMPGAVSPAAFERMTDYIVRRFMQRPEYLTLDGRSYFSVYDLAGFVAGIGGLDAARAAVERFRTKVRVAGGWELHLNAIVWGRYTAPARDPMGAAPRPTEDAARTVALAQALGCDSLASYTWIHHQGPQWDGFPVASYALASQRYAAWLDGCRRLPLPYHPNVTVGWDSTPRTSPEDPYEPRGYPWLPVLAGNTADLFQEGLERASAYARRWNSGERLVTVNAWNEWTEGSYLLPDALHGTAYLERIAAVVGPNGAETPPVA
jgi:hypothetical protein